MFALSHDAVVDEEVARDLCVVTDEVFAGVEGFNVGAAFSYLLLRDDRSKVVSTLLAGLSRLLALYRPDDENQPLYEMSDSVASTILGFVWEREEEIDLGRAILRTVLDDGSISSLPTELAELMRDEGESHDLMITITKLVTGMSAMKASVEECKRAGDPLREVFELSVPA